MQAKIVRRLQLVARALLYGETPTGPKRHIPAITEEEVAEAKTFFPLEKFFIFGHARSGTTLLTRLVRLHPQVHCNYQAHFFTRAPLLEGLVDNQQVGMWLSRNSNRWNRGRDLSPVVLRAAADFILEREARAAGKGSPGCLVGDKSPNSLLDGEAVRNLAKVYPDARLIFIVRDGRDAAVSHRFQAFIDRPHHLSPESRQIRAAYIRDPEPFLHGEESLFPTRELRQAAEGWAHNVEETNLTGRDLLGERYFSLRYEDLIARTHEEMLRLWDFLGVEIDSSGLKNTLDTELGRNPDADWQQEKAAEIAGSMRKGERGTWRELFTAHDRGIFKQAAGDTLIAWRYENDLNW